MQLTRIMSSIRILGMREHWKVPRSNLSEIIPTFGRVSHLMSILLGMGLYISLCIKSLKLHQDIINSSSKDVKSYTMLIGVERGFFQSMTYLNEEQMGEGVVKRLGRICDPSKMGAMVKHLCIGCGVKNYDDSDSECRELG